MDTDNENTLAGEVLYTHVKLSVRRCLHKIKDIMHQAINNTKEEMNDNR